MSATAETSRIRQDSTALLDLLASVVPSSVAHYAVENARRALTTLAREADTIHTAPDPEMRPTAYCGCGFPLVWLCGQWEHDAPPPMWGDDHDAHAPEPTGAAREHWDRVDLVTDDDDEEPGD